jgi:Pentapeptide repeats (8 copies)
MRRISAFLRRHLPIMLGALILLAAVVVLWIFSAPVAQWFHSAQSADAIGFLQEHLLVVSVVGGCLLIFALIWLPKWQASRVQDVKDRLTVENAARQTLAQTIGGAVLIAGLFFTWANLDVAQKNIKTTQETATENQRIAREGQITDRFTKAIAQLGEQGPDKLAVRLGGIYALERIAKDSKDDHWPVMEVLTAYVRETAPWPSMPQTDAQPSKGDQSRGKEPPTTQEQPPVKPATDIQAILTVLGRRTHTYGNGETLRLHLAKTDLRGASLWEAKLQGVRFWGAQLQGADLTGAQLQGADLTETQLQAVSLLGSQLRGAKLRGTRLEWAEFWGAQLQEADLTGAHLNGAKNLTVEQLSTVKTLYQAHLDPPKLRHDILALRHFW